MHFNIETFLNWNEIKMHFNNETYLNLIMNIIKLDFYNEHI